MILNVSINCFLSKRVCFFSTLAFLSRGYADGGRVEVSVFGGYQDTRGDAAKNSLSLLNALQDDARLMELKHFCVGRYNTKPESKEKNILSTESTAILKGIAVDLKVQRIFPACFEWGNLDDFKLQIADKRRLRDGKTPVDTEEANKTADSTFKPKSLVFSGLNTLAALLENLNVEYSLFCARMEVKFEF